MTSASTPLSGYSVNELHNEIQSRSGNIVDLGALSLEVNPEGGGGVYKSNAAYAECQDPFLERVQALLNPDWVIDIGANIGFTAIQYHRAFPNANLVVAEANPFLHEFIERNLARNGCLKYHLLDQAIGSGSSTVTFQINTAFTSDSRVNGLKESFMEVTVNQRTLDSLAEELDITGSTFIKIDTQGYERQVLLGCSDFLERNENHLIKLEFAPFLLELNETSPEHFLEDLTKRFRVAEIRQTRFHGDTPKDILNRQIQPTEVSAFVSYVRRLARSQEGWTDLLIAPKSFNP